MDKHTKQGLKLVWGQEAAKSRSIRRLSSAPYGQELKNYEQLLKQTIKNTRNPKVLVLGATPELRDLAIKNRVTTISADISQAILDRMTAVMKYKNSPKNIIINADWLEMDKIFKPETFDAILGDISLNNVPASKTSQLLRSLAILLKPNGCLIIRHYVFLPKKLKHNLAEIQKLHNQHKLDFVWLMAHGGIYGQNSKMFYDPKTKRYQMGKFMYWFQKQIQTKKFQAQPLDLAKFNNMIKHVGQMTQFVFSEHDWLKMVKKYFVLDKRLVVPSQAWVKYGAVWSFKKK